MRAAGQHGAQGYEGHGQRSAGEASPRDPAIQARHGSLTLVARSVVAATDLWCLVRQQALYSRGDAAQVADDLRSLLRAIRRMAKHDELRIRQQMLIRRP